MPTQPSQTRRTVARNASGPKAVRRPAAPLDVRLSVAARKKIEQAASRLGQSPSEFAAAAVLERAETVLRSAHVTVLNEAQWDRFVSTLTSPPAPTEALQDLMRTGAAHTRSDADGVTHFAAEFDEAYARAGTSGRS